MSSRKAGRKSTCVLCSLSSRRIMRLYTKGTVPEIESEREREKQREARKYYYSSTGASSPVFGRVAYFNTKTATLSLSFLRACVYILYIYTDYSCGKNLASTIGFRICMGSSLDFSRLRRSCLYIYREACSHGVCCVRELSANLSMVRAAGSDRHES